MNDLIDGVTTDGTIKLEGNDIFDKNINVADLRRRVGMVFQKPNPFPKSIYENVAYGLRIQGIKDRRTIDTLLRNHYVALHSGMKLKIVWMIWRWVCLEVNNNDWLSHVPLQLSRRSFCWMNRVSTGSNLDLEDRRIDL